MNQQQEKVHFDTFGFLVKRGLFSPDRMHRYSRWYDDGFDAACGPYDGTGHSQMLVPGIGLHPGFCDDYLADPRIGATLANLMGPGFLLAGSDAQRFRADTPWHQDSVNPTESRGAGEYLMLKVAMYLDDLSEQPGCLQIIPGSHVEGFGQVLRRTLRPQDKPIWADGLTPAGIGPIEVPGAVALRTRPGDIIFFDQECFHCSWGGQRGRRILAMTFAQRPTANWHVQWLVEHATSEVKSSAFAGSLYPRHLTATRRPELRSMIQFLTDKGF